MLSKENSVLIDNYQQQVQSHLEVERGLRNKKWRFFSIFVALLAGNPQQYHGQSFVPSKLSRGSHSTYWVAVVANFINVLTTAPALYFGFLNLGPFGLVLTSVMSTGILKLSNESASAASASTKGNRFWSSQGLMLFVSINILLSIISGIGSEIMVNRSGLRQDLAAELLDEKEQIRPNLDLYQAEIAECNILKREISSLPENDPKRRSAYSQAYGRWEPDAGAQLLSIPDEELKVCSLVAKKMIEARAAVTPQIEILQERNGFGNDVQFLENNFPTTYETYFSIEGEIISGAEEFRLAFEAFFGKLMSGEYSNLGKMGFSLFVFSISVVTSSGACFMMVAHSFRADTKLSHDPYVRSAIAEHLAYLERSILSDSSSPSTIDIESDNVFHFSAFTQKRPQTVNPSSASPSSSSQQSHVGQSFQSKATSFSRTSGTSKYKPMID
ncbi:MAG: hypothetical protein F6K11_16675 [Leptolyngbya sp. SIO3F4]|nr:hypothetical protein [Leptolyngbya sp. SIO3F4]